MAGLSAHAIPSPHAGAFDFALRMMSRACQHAGRGGIQIELPVAIGVRTGKFKEGSGRRVQDVRLLRRGTGGGIFKAQIDANLLEARKRRAQGLGGRAAAAPAVATLLACGLRT